MCNNNITYLYLWNNILKIIPSCLYFCISPKCFLLSGHEVPAYSAFFEGNQLAALASVAPIFHQKAWEIIIIYLCAVCAELLMLNTKPSPDHAAVWVRAMQEGWRTDLQTFVSLPPFSLWFSALSFNLDCFHASFTSCEFWAWQSLHSNTFREGDAEERGKRVEAEAPWPCSAVALETVMVTSSFSSMSGLATSLKKKISLIISSQFVLCICSCFLIRQDHHLTKKPLL